jgi:hypothetical protein
MKYVVSIMLFCIFLIVSGYKKKPEKSVTAITRSLGSNYLFDGTSLQQAKILLREVKENGVIAADSAIIEAPLKDFIGQPVNLSIPAVENYCTTCHIPLGELGFAGNKKADTTKNIAAEYFVIHDVSTPNYGNKKFPVNINDAGWAWNNLTKWTANVTHVFVNRLGQSKTITDFSDTMQATKFEKKVLCGDGAGKFIHIELIQPRKNQTRSPIKGSVAPAQGFTAAQYQRLALLYTIASLRKGKWLIPAFHACIDNGIPNGHDDPQHFNLKEWNNALNKLLENISVINS